MFHPSDESAVGRHHGDAPTLGHGTPDLLDDRVVSLSSRVHNLDCTCLCIRHASPGTAQQDEDDTLRQRRGVAELGMEPSGGMTTMTTTRAAIQQYTRRQIGAIWAAAALPMAALSWVIAPAIADHMDGPNALTRSLILFGQGAIRCHPYAQKEIRAMAAGDSKALQRALLGHAGFLLGNLVRSVLLGLTRGWLARSPVSGSTS